MISSVSHNPSAYYSLGQFLEIVTNKVSSETGRLLDYFLVEMPAEELEFVITQLSSNMHGVMADKRNGRTGRSDETPGKNRTAKNAEHYSKYIQDMSVQKMSPSIVPSVYAHVQGKGTYRILLDPNEEPIYELDGQKMTYSQVLTTLMSRCSNVSLEYEVPEVKPSVVIASCISGKDPDDVIMGKSALDEDALEASKVVLNCLRNCTTNDNETKGARINGLLKDSPSVTFVKEGKQVNVPIKSSFHHTSMDKYGVLDNGVIARAYYKAIGLDTKMTSSEQADMFFNGLDIDYSKGDVPEDIQKKYKHLFFNPTWFGDKERLTPERKEKLTYYWFAVVPGNGGIVLKRNDKPVPMWKQEQLLRPYLCTLRKVQMYYSLMRIVVVPDMREFIGCFCARNEIKHLAGFLLYSMSIYNEKVVIEVDVSKEDKKRCGKVFRIAEMLIANLPENMSDGFELEVPDQFKDFFTENVVDDTVGVSRSSLGTATNYTYATQKMSYNQSSPLPVVNSITPEKSESTSQGINEKVTNVPITIHRVSNPPVSRSISNSFGVGDPVKTAGNSGVLEKNVPDDGVDIWGGSFNSFLFDE
jgi:hypothetical protein